ncbi:MAG: PP2C family protein-serine/threonine phosphatase [Spirochaetes bacterium]|nr:PP2C family protein-serine/threonine phosphatase [Spirochaetota bacterium]
MADTGAAKGKGARAAEKPAKPKVKFSIRYKFAMAILSLVGAVIATMAIYIRSDSSTMLRDEIINLAVRETEHLATIAEDSFKSGDDLSLTASMDNMKKITAVEYAYVLDKKNVVRMALDPKKYGMDLSKDSATIEALKNQDPKKIARMEYPSSREDGGTIYEFSRPLINPLTTSREGTVRLGFSDRIIREKISRMTFNIIIMALIFFGVAIVGSIFLSGVIIKPIRKLAEGAAVIGTGNLDYRIDLKSSDELGQLAGEFNQMTTQLKKGKEMEIEKKLQDEQINVAKEIQEGLNPMGFYDRRGIQIKGYTRAAKGVGGDYFDYIDINENVVGALISDVSGKGIPASLVMVMIRTVFSTYVKGREVNCAKVVRAINDSLSADFAIDKFATLFFMIYDRRTGELAFSNAGHGPLRCYRALHNAITVSKLEGVPIGIMEDVDYKQAKAVLNIGDFVVLNTDGVTEMRNESREEYGYARLQKLLVENHELNANDMVELIVNDVDAFRGRAAPHDDLTILILKRTA